MLQFRSYRLTSRANLGKSHVILTNILIRNTVVTTQQGNGKSYFSPQNPTESMTRLTHGFLRACKCFDLPKKPLPYNS